MDDVTKSLIKEFVETQGIGATKESEQFEHFVNYLVAFDQVSSDFETELIATGEGEMGLDGLAISVNDVIVEDEEQLEDIIETARTLDVSFIFVQSKTASKFDLGEILKLFAAAKDFFKKIGSLNLKNKKISSSLTLKNILYEHAGKFSRGLPALNIYYATTGTWKDPAEMVAAVEAEIQELKGFHIFSDVKFVPIDAGRLQSLFFRTKNAVKAEVDLPNNVPLPPIDGVREAFIGVIRLSEYRKIILDEKGDVNKKIFFDNIRDFQGDTKVNSSIADTLSSPRAIQFPLRNNGVTVVARSLTRVGNKFVIEDYQVVNGCQTSHMIAGMAGRDDEDTIYCPIKIVNTEDEEAIRSIIIASNSQNGVDSESFWSLDEIHKKIEVFFQNKSEDGRLFYERRSGQYSLVGNIEKTRIVSRDSLLKSYAAMFREEINRVGRYYKDLIPQIGKTIFGPEDNLAPYYTAALSAWRLEFLFRTKRLSTDLKAFRFPLLLTSRLLVEKELGLDGEKRLSTAYCAALDGVLADADRSLKLFETANDSIADIVATMGEDYSRRVAKMREFRDRLIAGFRGEEVAGVAGERRVASETKRKCPPNPQGERKKSALLQNNPRPKFLPYTPLTAAR